jgi:DUF1365 family protein
MTAPASLYAGRVAHIRHAPFRHRFDYRMYMLAVDLDRLDETAENSRLFSHNKAGLISLHDKDHGFRDGRSLRAYAEAALRSQGLAHCAAKIIFVTMPRLLGYAFNPISFYFCHDASGRLGAVLHQVKNTFGDQIGYLMPVLGAGLIRQTAPKRMHVSPFFDMQGGYRSDSTRRKTNCLDPVRRRHAKTHDGNDDPAGKTVHGCDSFATIGGNAACANESDDRNPLAGPKTISAGREIPQRAVL